MKTDAPRVGGNVHFYRDKGFPGKRGPWPAIVLEVHPPSKHDGHFVRVRVMGEMSSTWTESDIPMVDDPELSEIRCCVLLKEQSPPVQPAG